MKKRFALSMVIGLMLVVLAILALNLAGQPAAAAPLLTRTSLTVTEITSDGVTDTLSAANADGHKFYNDGKTFLEVSNGSGGTITVTIVTPITYLGLAVADKTVAISNGATKFIGPFRPSLYNYTTGTDKGMVYVNYSAVTTTTVAAWRID